MYAQIVDTANVHKMMKKLTIDDEKLFLNFIHSFPIYTQIKAIYFNIEGVFLRDKYNSICFLHNFSEYKHGSSSEDPKADSRLYGYKFSWMFVEKYGKHMFSPEYLEDVCISNLKPLVKLKLL